VLLFLRNKPQIVMEFDVMRTQVDVIIPTILVCVLFGPAIPTLSFNFFYTSLVTVPFLLPSGQSPQFSTSLHVNS
jgi:hypothetical protein